VSVSIEIDGIPEAQRKVSWYSDKELFNRLRRSVRAGGKVMQGTLKAAAASEPTGNVPDTFRKVLAPKVSASRRRGGEIVASVRPKSPLFNIFEPGAGAHEIEGPLLTNFEQRRTWGPESKSGPFFARGRVRHPGFRKRPIAPTAFAAGKPGAQMAIARILFEEPPG
jgi:hypothetical protein